MTMTDGANAFNLTAFIEKIQQCFGWPFYDYMTCEYTDRAPDVYLSKDITKGNMRLEGGKNDFFALCRADTTRRAVAEIRELYTMLCNYAAWYERHGRPNPEFPNQFGQAYMYCREWAEKTKGYYPNIGRPVMWCGDTDAPTDLDNPRAQRLFALAESEGLLRGREWRGSKSDLAYFAEKACGVLGLKARGQGKKITWAPFERYFGITGLSDARRTSIRDVTRPTHKKAIDRVIYGFKLSVS